LIRLISATFINCNSNYNSLSLELNIYFSILENATISTSVAIAIYIIYLKTLKFYNISLISYSYTIITIDFSFINSSIAIVLAFNSIIFNIAILQTFNLIMYFTNI